MTAEKRWAARMDARDHQARLLRARAEADRLDDLALERLAAWFPQTNDELAAAEAWRPADLYEGVL